MTTREAARFFRVTIRTIYRWIKKKLVRAEKRGRIWDIPKQSKPGTAPERTPLKWPPYIDRETAEADGLRPEDFLVDKWEVSDVKLKIINGHLYYYCKIPASTPTNKGTSLNCVKFILEDEDGNKLDEEDSLPTDGEVFERVDPRVKLWDVLKPGTSLKVRLRAFPLFYYVHSPGSATLYGIGNRGRIKGEEKFSYTETLSQDINGNLSL